MSTKFSDSLVARSTANARVAPSRKGELWQQPRLIELHYPATITDIRDRDNWLKVMMLDRRLKERTRLILTRLALHLNIKSGRCDPSAGLLAAEVSLSGSPKTIERMARRALAEAEKFGWIRKTHRHGGDAKRQNQSNQYALTVPEDLPPESYRRILDDRTNRDERPDSGMPDDLTLQSEATGLWSQANSECMNSEENSESRTQSLRTIDSNWESDERGWMKKEETNFPSNSNASAEPL